MLSTKVENHFYTLALYFRQVELRGALALAVALQI
jgi:hypothetical protein